MSNFKQLVDAFWNGDIEKSEFIQKAAGIHNGLFAYCEILKSCDLDEIIISTDNLLFSSVSNGISLVIPEGESRVAPLEIMNFGSYEPEETYWIDRLIRGCNNFVDVGANVGWFSNKVARSNPELTVYAFEPIPETFKFLQKNISINGLGGQIHSYNFGLSNQAGSFKFHKQTGNGTNASLLDVSGAADREILCLTLTLDEWRQNNDVKVDFIKCDVEGAELLVFQGASKCLEEDTPIVFTELLRKWSKPFGYHPNDLLKFMTAYDYQCFAVGKDGLERISLVTDETLETNFIFLHQVEHKHVIESIFSSRTN